MIMKRFWLFHRYHYYPCDGMEDFKGSYDSLQEAEGAIPKEEYKFDWVQILDVEERTVHFVTEQRVRLLEDILNEA